MELYRDQNAPIEERVNDLISRMTLPEKIRQLDQYSWREFFKNYEDYRTTEIDWEQTEKTLNGYSVGSIQSRNGNARLHNQLQKYIIEHTRLGIPAMFSEEGLHTVHRNDGTCFPQQIMLASTFEPEMGYRMGRAIGTEARAIGFHELFSPVMDLGRDPRWGRTEEGCGEDTHLASKMAAATVRGLQGEGIDRPDAVASEPKHYTGYGSPAGGLNCAPSTMNRHEVYAYCQPVFEAAFTEGKATNAMCSYCSIDGVPVAMDHEILTDILRGQYGMPGFVRSDMIAVAMLHTSHYVADSPKQAMKLGLNAGVDLMLYDFPHDVLEKGVSEMIASGEMDEAVINQAVSRVLRVKFMLGLFEHPYVDESLEGKKVHCKAHQETALEIARKGCVLLKNNGILPLCRDKVHTVAVVGPNAEHACLGDYSVDTEEDHLISVLDGVRAAVNPGTRVLYEKGCCVLNQSVMPIPAHWFADEEGNRGLTGRYYNGSEIAGEPVAVRCDSGISFNWIYSKPHPDIDSAKFCVQWTGTLCPWESFSGNIGLSSTDSMRLYVDGELLVDGWGIGKSAEQMVPFVFEKGRSYQIRIDYRNDGRGVRVIFGYNKGVDDYRPALKAAEEADVVIACMGDNNQTSGENVDRTTLDLPGRQLDFLKKLYETGKPIVLVVQSGRPVSLNWEQEHLDAILEAWFPGEKGGQAVAEILFGNVNPSGRLPVSFPKSAGQIPCNYNRKPAGGRRYVEMDWLPLYPFGFGLTYTQFAYSDLRLSKDVIRPDESVEVRFRVKNTGSRPGEETAQVYVHDKFSSVVRPIKELQGFRKILLQPGEEQEVVIPLGFKELRTLTRDFRWVVEPGEFEIMVGSNAENLLLETVLTVQE